MALRDFVAGQAAKRLPRFAHHPVRQAAFRSPREVNSMGASSCLESQSNTIASLVRVPFGMSYSIKRKEYRPTGHGSVKITHYRFKY